MTTIHRCMIVEASQRDFAAWLCEQLAGPPGAGMFERGLSPTGQAPATHYGSSGLVEAEFDGALSNPEILHYVCRLKGVSVTLGQCAALLDVSDVSTDQPLDALDRLGLQLLGDGTE